MSDISIPQRDLRRLMQSPHRIAAFHGKGSRDRVTRAVGDAFDADIGRTVASLARQRLIRMDDVSCALLEDHGINPAVTAALRNEIHVFTVRSGFTTVCDIQETMKVRIGKQDVWWHPSDGIISRLPEVPETLVQTLQGAPLTRLVSHPVLDAFDLTVGGVKDNHGTFVMVRGTKWLSEELERYCRPLDERGKAVG